jgi:hypothetical protein
MSNVKKGPTNEQVEQAREAMNNMVIGRESALTWEQAFEILEKAPDEAMNTINGQYLELELGKTYNVVLEGFDTISVTDKFTKTKKDVEVVKLRDRNNQLLLCGAATVVSSCKRVEQLPAWIRIIVADKKKKGDGGDYYDTTVKTF